MPRALLPGTMPEGLKVLPRNECANHAHGRDSSHFVNPDGLSPRPIFDCLIWPAWQGRSDFNPLLRDIMGTKHCSFCYAMGKRFLCRTQTVCSDVFVLQWDEDRSTDAAGHCLISSGSWNGKDVIAVVPGSNRGHVWQESASLLAYGWIGDTQLTSLRAVALPIRDARSKWPNSILWMPRRVFTGIDYAAELNAAPSRRHFTAGPGSGHRGRGYGKTRTLTYRVACLLEQGVPARAFSC